MELKEFTNFLENSITEEAFEAMALHFAKQHYDIIGCDFNIRDNVKIYKLHRRYAGEECYLVINYYNENLDASMYPKDEYMIAENNIDTLMCLSDALYLSDRIRARMPYCLKDICNYVFSLTKYPLKYYSYECQNKFYDYILNKHEKSEENYLEKLCHIFQKCKKETLSLLNESGLLANKKDWNSRNNIVTITYANGNTECFQFFFEMDGLVTVTNKEKQGGFCCYIVDDTDIKRFVDRVLRLVNLYN